MQIALALFDPPAVDAAGVNIHELLLQARARGHSCRVYSPLAEVLAMEGVSCHQLPLGGRGRHRQHAAFVRELQAALARQPADVLIGFEPQPELDALLPIAMPRQETRPSGWAGRLSGANRYFAALENAVFHAPPPLLFLSSRQQLRYRAHYALDHHPQLVLPPGAPPELPLEQAREVRRLARSRWALAEGELVLLFAGSDFERQGLSRAIRALAHAREQQPHQKMRLLVAARGRLRSYHHLARKLGVLDAVHFLQGREAAAELMLGADTLVHPAAAEPAGAVLLQALVAGLPVITTEESGYAQHIAAARAGLVLRSPFQQTDLDQAVLRCIDGIYRSLCRDTGQTYARLTDIHSLPEACINQLEQWHEQPAGVGAPQRR